jgi:hypothetical protein
MNPEQEAMKFQTNFIDRVCLEINYSPRYPLHVEFDGMFDLLYEAYVNSDYSIRIDEFTYVLQGIFDVGFFNSNGNLCNFIARYSTLFPSWKLKYRLSPDIVKQFSPFKNESLWDEPPRPEDDNVNAFSRLMTISHWKLVFQHSKDEYTLTIRLEEYGYGYVKRFWQDWFDSISYGAYYCREKPPSVIVEWKNITTEEYCNRNDPIWNNTVFLLCAFEVPKLFFDSTFKCQKFISLGGTINGGTYPTVPIPLYPNLVGILPGEFVCRPDEQKFWWKPVSINRTRNLN